MASLSGELRRATVASLAVLAGIGFSATRPVVAEADCNIPQQIGKITEHVRQGGDFQWTTLHPKLAQAGIVKVFAKNAQEAKNDQFIIDPLVIECGARAVRYVGITDDPDSTLGQRYSTGRKAALYKTGKTERVGDVYLDVVTPQDTEPQEDTIGVNPLPYPLEVTVNTMHFQDLYDRDSDVDFPAFANGPQIFGQMSGEVFPGAS